MELMTGTNWRFSQNELKGFIYKRVKDKTLREDLI